mgnify:CR=1 FL=1|jgi:hypothetical protein
MALLTLLLVEASDNALLSSNAATAVASSRLLPLPLRRHQLTRLTSPRYVTRETSSLSSPLQSSVPSQIERLEFGRGVAKSLRQVQPDLPPSLPTVQMELRNVTDC